MNVEPGAADGRLPKSEARLISLSAAIASGNPAHIAEQSECAIQEGASPAAVYETLIQSYLFLGFPRAIEALFAAKPVLERHGGIRAAVGGTPPADPASWMRSGESLCRRVYGKNYAKLVETMRGLSPDLASWMIQEGYGKTLSRPGLDATEREYCVVAVLATTRMWRQLRSHAIGAVNVGGTRARVRETIQICEPYAGSETVAEALRVVGMEHQDARG